MKGNRSRSRRPVRKLDRRRANTQRAVQQGESFDAIPLPVPSKNLCIQFAGKLVYGCQTAGQYNITFQNLCDTFLFAASATAGYEIFSIVKVKSVEIWTALPSGNVVASYVEFNGAVDPGDNVRHGAIAVGTRPGYVHARPTKKAVAGFTQPGGAGGANQAFVLRLNVGDIVRLSAVWYGNYEEQVAAQNALVGATVGATYMRGLDGKAVAATGLPIQPSLDVII